MDITPDILTFWMEYDIHNTCNTNNIFFLSLRNKFYEDLLEDDSAQVSCLLVLMLLLLLCIWESCVHCDFQNT